MTKPRIIETNAARHPRVIAILLAGLGLASLLTGCGQPAPTWKKYSAGVDLFVATFPGDPERTTEPSGLIGDAEVHTYTAKASGATFVVRCCDVSEEQEGTPETLYELADKQFGDGKTGERKELSLGHHAGVAFDVTGAGREKRVRYIIGHGKFYQVLVDAPQGGLPVADALKFAQSFGVTH